MSQLVTDKKPGRKTRKKPSAFEKLWTRAKKLKAENEKLAADLEKTLTQMRETILPRELEVTKSQKPLLIKLLTFGQRKSMTNWEREVLDEWIRDTLEDIQQFNLIDEELLNHLGRYDAFRLGISLEDNDVAPHEQIAEKMQEQREQQRQEEEASHEALEKYREEIKTHSHPDIEKQLDDILGPRPEITAGQTDDLWADDLEAMQKQHQEQYDTERDTLRQQMIDELLAALDAATDATFGSANDTDAFEDFLNEPYDDDEDRHSYSDSMDNSERKTELTDTTFQNLFRATAAKLHPDREPDPDTRLKKQSLMAKLLKARKGGDLLTILELYENWVGEHHGFSKSDEKSLQRTLQSWIDNLENEKEEIIMQSPLHFRAFNIYHYKSQRKTERAISERLAELQKTESTTAIVTNQITSLKSLKPYLEDRYESRFSFHGFFD